MFEVARNVEELARHFEDKCNFSPEEGAELAGKIEAERTASVREGINDLF